MARRVSFSLDGTWKRVRVSADYSGKAAAAGIDYNNIIYVNIYGIITPCIYLIRRKMRE
jgi:hypothetical protein